MRHENVYLLSLGCWIGTLVSHDFQFRTVASWWYVCYVYFHTVIFPVWNLAVAVRGLWVLLYLVVSLGSPSLLLSWCCHLWTRTHLSWGLTTACFIYNSENSWPTEEPPSGTVRLDLQTKHPAATKVNFEDMAVWLLRKLDQMTYSGKLLDYWVYLILFIIETNRCIQGNSQDIAYIFTGHQKMTWASSAVTKSCICNLCKVLTGGGENLRWNMYSKNYIVE